MNLPPESLPCPASMTPGANRLPNDRYGRRQISYQGYTYWLGVMGGECRWWRGGMDNSDLNALLAAATHATSVGKLDRALIHNLLESRFWDYLTLTALAYLTFCLGSSAFQALLVSLGCYLRSGLKQQID